MTISKQRRNFINAGLALGISALSAIACAEPAFNRSANAQNSASVKTLVIAYPYPERSVFIKGLQEAAETVDNVTVRNLESIYGFDTRAAKLPEYQQALIQRLQD